MDQPPEPRYLTEPYLTTQLDLARVVQTLRHLADATRSPLPRRLRHRLLRIARMLARIQQELHDAPGRIEAERWRED